MHVSWTTLKKKLPNSYLNTECEKIEQLKYYSFETNRDWKMNYKYFFFTCSTDFDMYFLNFSSNVSTIFSQYQLILPLLVSEMSYTLEFFCPTNGREVLFSKLVDGMCLVQFPVALVDLTVRNFPWFSQKLAQMRVRTPQKEPHAVRL